jgi:uncharacterized phage-associated protein
MTIRYSFDERKTTQAACHLLGLSGGRSNYMKLIKLLYLADRKAILEDGCPISGDNYVSMDKGPVLSKVYEIIMGKREADYWQSHIEKRERHDVELIHEDVPIEELSEHETDILDGIYGVYGHLNEWQLVRLCHDMLPEWKDPEGSSVPIDVEYILILNGWYQTDIAGLREEVDAANALESLSQVQ